MMVTMMMMAMISVMHKRASALFLPQRLLP